MSKAHYVVYIQDFDSRISLLRTEDREKAYKLFQSVVQSMTGKEAPEEFNGYYDFEDWAIYVDYFDPKKEAERVRVLKVRRPRKLRSRKRR